jgi:hypothetical protein
VFARIPRQYGNFCSGETLCIDLCAQSSLLDIQFSSGRDRTEHCCNLAVQQKNQTVCASLRYILRYEYNETNVMQFTFSLLRINSLCMFRALLAHPQEALNKRHLVYCVRAKSVGCVTIAVNTIAVKLKSWHSQLTLHARNMPSAVCVASPEDEQAILERCRGS